MKQTTDCEVKVTVDMNRILKDIGSTNNKYRTFPEVDIDAAMSRIDALFQHTTPLNTTAVICGWCPGWMNWNVAKHVMSRTTKQFRVSSEGKEEVV